MYRKCQVSKIIDLLNMKRQYFYSSLIFSILVFRALAFADGGMVIWPPAVHLDQTAQNAIVAWNGEEEIIILSNDIKSDSKATVLRIVPLPSNPTEIKEADPNCFEKLVELMNEKLKAIRPSPPGYPAPPGGIEIIFHEKIGAHDVTVVKVNNLDYFLSWIKNFAQGKGLEVKEISPTFKDGVANYLKREIEYFVFDVIEPEAGEESIKPLIYRFNSDSLYYPLLISGISEIRESEAKINLFLITPKEAVIFNPPYSYYRYPWFYSYGFGVELTEEELQEVSEDLRDLFEGPVKARRAYLYGRLNQITRDLSLYPSHFWDKDLTLGSSGEEVKALQKILINEGVWDSDLKATGYFGPITKNALAKFQEKYLGYMIGSGYFDPETREYLKKLSIKPWGQIIYVDAVNGDDNNNGLTPEAAFATIQKGINTAEEGYTVLVYPGVYQEELDFLGKAITVKSAEDAAVLEASGGLAVSFHYGEEPNSVLKNFVIRNSYMGIFVAGSSPTISNVTVVDNEYGVAAVWAEPDISSSIFWNNTGGDLFECQVRYSDIEEGCPGEGNIDTAPCFVDLNNGDYHLKSEGWRWDTNRKVWTWDDVTSPCIDAGNPGCALGDELLSVPDDPNNEWGENLRINMGAYGGTAEASMGLPGWALLADLTNDGIVDFVDLAVFVDYWLETGDCIPSDLNRNQSVDFSDFAIFADNWLKGEGDEPGKPGLARYYVPYDNPVEPSAPGYSLPLNLGAVGNYADMDSKFGLSNVAPLLEQNGFAVIEYDFHDSNDIVKPYEYLRKMDVPLFVTADTLLHLYHVQFDETLKDVEEREFVSDINELTAALLDDALGLYEEYAGDLKEAARRNVAYLAVAQKLIDPNAEVPQLVSDVVASELAKIDAHEGFAPSDIFIYLEDYSQYVPRGHYTRSEELKRYFRTLMWYGRMAFLLKGGGDALITVYDAKVQTMQAVLLATSIEEVKVGERSGRQIWDRLYAVTSFYVGLADDLTPYEYLGAVNKVFGSSFVATDLLDEDKFFTLKVELALLRSPKIYGGTGDIYPDLPLTPQSLDEVLDKTKGMRFMGQRFIPDSYMFQQLVTPKVLDYTGDGNPIPFSYGTTLIGPQRCYPRGLDVMAILGSARAKTILVEGGDTDYVNYVLRFDELKAEFDAFDISDWNRNLYWSWLYSLRALIDEFPEGYPNFMRTEAWEKKELNAALASWTELRHDTILYAKQSYTPPPPNGGPPPPPDVTGYVEPVPEFYGRLLALTRMTRQGLSDLNVLSAQATERLVSLEDILSRLIEIANKELMNQALSDDDYEYIMGFGKTLEGAVIGVEEKGVKTTLVADVHTYSYEAQVVEEGVGYVDLIIVACPIADGSIIFSAGPVLSYYEFKHPMNDRLTDEAWRELLDSPQRPDRPTWWF